MKQRHAEEIFYATAPSSLGNMLVACDEVGICAVLLHEDNAFLRQDLAQRFQHAQQIEDAVRLAPFLRAVAALIDAPSQAFNLPLSLRGTEFQCRVWAALRSVAAGNTASYTEIAHRIGKPTAMRAVAGACAANPLAVIVPCHRILRADGGISGYRWGVEHKRTLLAREAAHRLAA